VRERVEKDEGGLQTRRVDREESEGSILAIRSVDPLLGVED
jgi:hypothetical protein